jgi:uncharacterized NAD(P)/FAD-binding protein YdhS
MNLSNAVKKRVAIIGGGPSGLFVLKRFIKSDSSGYEIHIFEKTGAIGPGMPYSTAGANEEHITNVSDNETPELITDIKEWIKREPPQNLQKYGIDPNTFHAYQVLPRLLFGKYLAHQFHYMRDAAKTMGLDVITHYNSEVTDIAHIAKTNEARVTTADNRTFLVDYVIICTGHTWPTKYEKSIPGYFDSPYPPSKLTVRMNHPVAIRGASLSAIDAIKTIARHNGTFTEKSGKLSYQLSADSTDFKIALHSRNGLLPAFRFHLENVTPSSRILLTEHEIQEMRSANEGFLPLDNVFEKKFKEPLKKSDPEFYEEIRHLTLEQFTELMLQQRENIDPFFLFKAEFKEAEKSIQRKQSVYWKELLAEFSFILNYPAKYLSAEDMLRLQRVLMPLISVVIAFIPQSSGRELMALHEAGVLSLRSVGNNSEVVPESIGGATYYFSDEQGDHEHFKTFIDCVGQRHFRFEDFPFKSLIDGEVITGARIKFQSPTVGMQARAADEASILPDSDGSVYLKLPGIAVNDNFQVVDKYGSANSSIYVMAVPFISGFNPDYSGLDFCERASAQIVTHLTGSHTLHDLSNKAN